MLTSSNLLVHLRRYIFQLGKGGLNSWKKNQSPSNISSFDHLAAGDRHLDLSLVITSVFFIVFGLFVCFSDSRIAYKVINGFA